MANGEKKRLYVRGKSQRDVNLKLAELKTQYDNGTLVLNPSSTFEHWTKEWLETYKKPKVSAGWYKDIESILNNWFLPKLGAMRISDIKQTHIQSCLNDLAGKSWSYVNKATIIIKEIMAKAVKNEFITRNPADDLEKPRTTRGERRALTEEERQRLLDACELSPHGGFFAVMLPVPSHISSRHF